MCDVRLFHIKLSVLYSHFVWKRSNIFVLGSISKQLVNHAAAVTPSLWDRYIQRKLACANPRRTIRSCRQSRHRRRDKRRRTRGYAAAFINGRRNAHGDVKYGSRNAGNSSMMNRFPRFFFIGLINWWSS